MNNLIKRTFFLIAAFFSFFIHSSMFMIHGFKGVFSGRLTPFFVTKGSNKWMKVNEKKSLVEILRQEDYIIPGIPGSFIQSFIFHISNGNSKQAFLIWLLANFFPLTSSSLFCQLFIVCSILYCFKDLCLLQRIQSRKMEPSITSSWEPLKQFSTWWLSYRTDFFLSNNNNINWVY